MKPILKPIKSLIHNNTNTDIKRWKNDSRTYSSTRLRRS